MHQKFTVRGWDFFGVGELICESYSWLNAYAAEY